MQTTHIQKLRALKFKLTPKRQAILDYFIKEGRYLTPEHIWGKLKKDFKHLGLPSIYRNLDTFESCGILVKIQREDRRLYYALCHSSHGHEKHQHHHHHIVCVKCGKVANVEGCALAGMNKVSGFKVLKHIVQLEGLCPQCTL